MTINTLSVLAPTRQPADLSPADPQWENPSMPHTSRVVDNQAYSSKPTFSGYPVAATEQAQTAVLTIRNLPRRLRSNVESAMVVCIPSPSELFMTDADPLTANWCTSWYRSSFSSGQIDCRETITGTERELGHLRDMLGSMAREHDFDASVRIIL
ncbi:hypothetical protein [Corynebacterium halotolerans]|uniref:hypothetical protein n=1 Tax=Corynebacterium halotolerans TaxID=225326 RepID=UPI003CF052E5